MINLYDADTTMSVPNFPPGEYAVNVGKCEYMGYIYDEFIKQPENSCYTYEFILINNGKIIAMGEEQGRCGGISCTCENADFAERLKSSRAYDKVKHLPIASPDELEKPIYRYCESLRELEKYKKFEKFMQYRLHHCNYHSQQKMCYFQAFDSTQAGGFYKPCNGQKCRNYQHFLSIEEMCMDCKYNKKVNGDYICTHHEETGDIERFGGKFHNYKCTGFNNKNQQ